MDASTATLLDFAAPGAPRFQALDDRVMGGRSMSRLRNIPQAGAVFEGVVSLEHGGGFASVRAGVEETNLSAYLGVVIRLRGDGRRYRLTLRNDRRISGVNHMHEFPTRPGEWEEIALPFEGFVPSLRGTRPAPATPLDPRRIRQVGFMIADARSGPFRLEVAWIRGWDGTTPRVAAVSA